MKFKLRELVLKEKESLTETAARNESETCMETDLATTTMVNAVASTSTAVMEIQLEESEEPKKFLSAIITWSHFVLPWSQE